MTAGTLVPHRVPDAFHPGALSRSRQDVIQAIDGAGVGAVERDAEVLVSDRAIVGARTFSQPLAVSGSAVR
jgi:hypothetical protein